MLLVGKAVWGIYAKYEKSKDIALRAREELVALEERQKDLTASIASLKTPEGEEKELRNKFGVVKEGERMIILVDERATSNTAAVVESKNWWQKLIGVFK
jgi:cell division protein FtsB